ncbi:MAG: acetate/propionate family kinase [Myxococcales bacterium]|nr:acetate/propionate family kinase [Myxococcales bacterium]
MHILVINCGSSSLKAALFDHSSGSELASLRVERIGEQEPSVRVGGATAKPLAAATDHRAALEAVLPDLLAALPEGAQVAAVGHRVVHGGDKFSQAVRIDDDVERAIDALSSLAPLHNPANLAGVRAARALLPEALHVAVFDTAFHATLPRRAQTYALPQELASKHGIRRYGFHGPSHAFVSARAAEWLESDLRDVRLITCHLGNGCSATAVEYGRSVETSMGMTPLEGLVMGSRSGDIDAGALLSLMRAEGLDVDAIDELLNRRSGLAGLSGVGRDLRDIEERAAEGDEACRLAIQVFAHRVRKYIGAYAAVMGGVDAIVFTGGIGENSALMRHRIAQRLDFLGARLDEDKNRAAKVTASARVAQISTERSRCHLLVVATDEQRAIAEDAARIAVERDRLAGAEALRIPVAISARHVHLTDAVIERLYGAGHQLRELKPLSQPGQYAAEETVTLVGPKRSIEDVRVLGPARSKCQVEISRTDEFHLGIDAPVRASGDVENSPGLTLVGPAGRVELKQGVICAWRHIHMTPEDAKRFGVKDRDVVDVAVDSEERSLVFGDVLVRVSPKYKLEMHIDTDEGNAAELSRGAEGALVKSSGVGHLTRRGTRFDREMAKG